MILIRNYLWQKASELHHVFNVLLYIMSDRSRYPCSGFNPKDDVTLTADIFSRDTEREMDSSHKCLTSITKTKDSIT